MDPLVCIDAGTEPSVPSTLVLCSQCGHSLWRSNDSFQHTDLEPWCYRCIMVETKGEQFVVAVRPDARLAVVEKMMDEDGLTREAAERVVDHLLERMNEQGHP